MRARIFTTAVYERLFTPGKYAIMYVMKFAVLASLVLLVGTACGQPKSPPATAEATIAGKKITIQYSAPSVRGRQMFGEGGVISKDDNYPVWRTGANAATSLTTDGELTFGSLKVPAGKYSLFTTVKDSPWELIINKESGISGLAYKQAQDLGRVKMTMSKPAAKVETLKISITSEGGNKGKLTIEFENVVASASFTVK